VSEAHPRHLQRLPSWAQADMPPPEGAWCAACHGQRWWTADCPEGLAVHGLSPAGPSDGRSGGDGRRL